MINAFESIGFLYLKNTGLTQDEVGAVIESTLDVFNMPIEMKEKFARGQNYGRHGWLKFEDTRLDPKKPCDLREAYSVIPPGLPADDSYWPNLTFKEKLTGLYEKLKIVADRLLIAIAIGLNLDQNYFLQHHKKAGGDGNVSGLNCFLYPELKESNMQNIKPGQLRCGEHNDFGSLTLLVSDDIKGLQVLNRDNRYVDIPKFEDTSYILVNIGALMERWTNGRLVAAKHRVVFNKLSQEIGTNQQFDHVVDDDNCDRVVCSRRLSYAFYIAPDNDVMITPTQENPLYPPITAMGYFTQRRNETKG